MNRILTLAVAMTAIVFLAPLSRAVAQTPSPNVPRIVGQWSGKCESESDGTLTLAVLPAPGRRLTYQFSGGKQEHGSGTYRLQGANRLLFTPDNAQTKDDDETWHYSFDEFGRLHVEMEEDNLNDRETYILDRVVE